MYRKDIYCLMNFQKLKVRVDRPIGYKDDFDNIYPLNYGYIPGIIGGDGEEQDVYILSNTIKGPIDEFIGKLIAIVHRNDDVEEKWVVSGTLIFFIKTPPPQK